MSDAVERLGLATAPFVHRGLDTRRIMWEVLGSLVIVIAASAWWFGLAALLVVAAASIGAVATEWLFATDRRSLGSLRDGSALLTGVLLALTLPPSTPLWMAFLGGIVGVALGKTIWGGLGQNLFNPALVGRSFLQAEFPQALTTWTAHGGSFWDLPGSTLAVPFARASVDAVTTATPLGMAKFDKTFTPFAPLMTGQIPGSLGETAGWVLVAIGVYLAVRGVFDWRLAVSTLATVAVLSEAFHRIAPETYPGAAFMIGSGGLLFAAVYMVTDPVSTPITPRGAWIFGIGTGALVVLIRYWGGLPEGVMYAILLMNSVTPLINRVTQPRRFGA